MSTFFLETIIKIAVAIGIPLAVLPIIIHVERRGAAFIQKRVGPNRVGPLGLLQPLADVVKFLFKEEVRPEHVKPFFYQLAPILALFVSLIPLAALPLCAPFELMGQLLHSELFRTDLGIFFVFGATSLGSFAILIAGWASNNKFSMLGGIRAAAQMISYELSMGLSLVAIFLTYDTHDIHSIVGAQAQVHFSFLPHLGLFIQPIAALIFLVGIFAESNRLPFDLAEGESELVAGYHVEYSSMKFALFFMAEYIHMIVLSTVFTVLFLGGYNFLPFFDLVAGNVPALTPVLQFLSLFIKVALLIWLFVWVRWSLPRFRYDQLMKLGWKVLLPLGMANLIITVLIAAF